MVFGFGGVVEEKGGFGGGCPLVDGAAGGEGEEWGVFAGGIVVLVVLLVVVLG